MTVVLSTLVFFIGVIVGALVFKFSSKNQEHQALNEKVEKSEAELAQYKLNVAEHLDNSAKMLEQMNSTCQAAMQQMAESTQLLQQATPTDLSSMPFFSKETQEQLAQTVGLRHSGDRKNDISITEPPLDYSGEASGLFQDKTQSVTNTAG